MTSRPDADALRATLIEALQRAVDSLEGGYAAPVRRQLRAGGDVYEPAVFCLGLGQVLGDQTRCLPPAIALALLEEMGRLFLSLDTGDEPSASWGMPRALNAADGLYALAQKTLLEEASLSPDAQLEVMGIFSQAARDFSEALHAWSTEDDTLVEASRSLLSAAASLAALCCGLDQSSTNRLDELAREFASSAAPVSDALQMAAAFDLRRA